MAGRRRLVLVAGCVLMALLASVPWAQGVAPERRGDPIRIRVGKDPDGPFARQTHINLVVGAKKSLYFRVNSAYDEDRETHLASDPNADGYRVRWYRGRHEISDEVNGPDGFVFNLKAHDKRTFEATVKRTASTAEESCVEATVFIPAVLDDTTFAGVNGSCVS